MGSSVREDLTDEWRVRYDSRGELEELQKFRLGVALFNSNAVWHAHEVWEELWKEGLHKGSPPLQALIQLAACMVHWRNKNAHGAYTLLHRCRANLAKGEGALYGWELSEIKEKAGEVLNLMDAGVRYKDGPPIQLVVDG